MSMGSYADFPRADAREAAKTLRIQVAMRQPPRNRSGSENPPPHIDAMIQGIVKRGTPSMANDILRWVQRIFDHAIKLQRLLTR